MYNPGRPQTLLDVIALDAMYQRPAAWLPGARLPGAPVCTAKLPFHSFYRPGDTSLEFPNALRHSGLNAPLLAASGLACERDGRVLFEAIEIQVEAGGMLQIGGPNGSGKTSLLRILAGLSVPSAGMVFCGGQPRAELNGRMAEYLLWIGHAAGIKGILTATENLQWLTALRQPVSTAEIHRALQKVGLAHFSDVPCRTLSAGQQRRVALARLHLPGAPLWILDEPFTALDKTAITDLEAHLLAHCASGGAVVLTSHHAFTERPADYRLLALDHLPHTSVLTGDGA